MVTARRHAAGLARPAAWPPPYDARLRARSDARDLRRLRGPRACGTSSTAAARELRICWRDGLAERFAGLEVVGTYTPPFRPLRPDERQAVIEMIERSSADIVWVGLSTPKQERWMADIAPDLRVPVLIGVGAAFDFLAGLKPQAPRWMQRGGLEWLFRLTSEPRRLWRRYLVSVGVFPWLVTWQLLWRRIYEQ